MAFREPHIKEMSREGDKRRFLCLMEVEFGQIVAGTFTILPKEENSTLCWARKLEQAWGVARERAERNAFVSPSATWEEIASWGNVEAQP